MKSNTSTVWLIPCNVELYDPFRAFATLKFIDWRQSSQISVGDEVYIYCSKPYKKIMFRTIVLKANISIDEADQSDKPFYKNGLNRIGNIPRFGYMRLQLVNMCDNEELSLEKLMNNGMNSAPQGPRRIKGNLLKYIEDRFK